MSLTLARRAVLPLAVLLAPCALAGEVWTVAPQGVGADFAQIQAAIDVAGDGDTVLVQPGSGYSGSLLIENKDLVLLVDGGGLASGMGLLEIRNVPASKSVVVSGVRSSLEVRDCGGEVLVHNGGDPAGPLGATLAVEFSDNVSLDRCQFVGAGGASDGADGDDAALIWDSRVALYRVSAQGGDGAGGVCLVGPGDGGDGLVVQGQSVVRAVNCTLLGGEGGFTSCQDGAFGADVNVFPGADFSTEAHAELELSGPILLREGETITLELQGLPGLQATSLVSTELRFRILPESVGVLHLESPFDTAPLGPITPGGTLQWTLTGPPLGAGDEARTRFVQIVVMDSGTRYLSNVFALTVLDSGI